MSNQPTVSVVIPCYNASPFLRETLDSVLAQTHPVLEVILVDDGSTDDSASIAESYGPPVRVIRQPNQGESVARNRGIDESRSDWIAFLDADDIWLPHRIEAQLRACTSKCVAAHCNIEVFGAESYTTQIESVPPELRYSLTGLCLDNVFYTPSAMLVRRDVCPRFPDKIQHGEDLVFCLELVQRGVISFVPEPLVRYRRHRSAQSSNAITRIGCFTTIDNWMVGNASKLPKGAMARIRNQLIGRLVGLAWSLKESRRWDEYWKVRKFLMAYRSQCDVAEVIENRIYPRIVYWVKDLCAR